jgi:hypothetical protein
VHLVEHVEAGRIRTWLSAARDVAALLVVVYGLFTN